MPYIEDLVREFGRMAALPWERNLAGQQKVWFVVYPPTEERRLRARVSEFELAAKRAGHGWVHIDLTDAFARWMAAQEYRESYFESPVDLDLALRDFADELAGTVRLALSSAEVDENAVVGISGVASLFGTAKVSELIRTVAPEIRGRLAVFFPGERDGNNYRLLDAREGWNYLAIPITASRDH